MDDDDLRCSGYISGRPRGSQACKHGFRTSVACWPVTIEQAARVVPMCCDEEACGELFKNNGGKPFQYSP